jgi:outer membrane receptor protein involved in Fe transport
MVNNRVRASSSLRSAQIAIVAALVASNVPVWSAHAQRVAATTNPAEATQRVTLRVKKAPLLPVLQTIAQKAGVSMLFNEAIVPSDVLVTLDVQDVPMTDVFAQALRGTGLMAKVYAAGNITIIRDPNVPARRDSRIAGRVLDAKSQQPIRKAAVGLDGDDRVTETADDGSFLLRNLAPGRHVVTIKRLGYTRVTREVVVPENETFTLAVALESSATPLDQVVVTGTVIPTELKAVPNAITVITAKQIEERGITKIDQLFRGDVPGLFAQNNGVIGMLDEVTMFSRGATALSSLSAGTSTPNGVAMLTNPIKTYIDGVEMADATYLSQIDPKSIERIEILSGPQASTIYGSNAINGVMQIFTKRGMTPKPQLTLSVLSGLVENNFSNARTAQHDYAAQVNGTEGRIAYNAGGSWNYAGPWTPGKRSARVDGYGGARFAFPVFGGPLTADVSLRRGTTQSLVRGATSQTTTNYRQLGWYTVNSGRGASSPQTWEVASQTLGFTLGYTPVQWWTHELSVGRDVSDVDTRITAAGYLSTSDTTLRLTETYTERRSLRYATTGHIPVTSRAAFTVTAGADQWQSLSTFLGVSPQSLTGNLTGAPTVTRQPAHNAGGFLQTQLALFDAWFLTYGVRAEWNPNFGDDQLPNYAPRAGIAYTRAIGAITTKVRASYGRSTRPPARNLKSGVLTSVMSPSQVQYYGDVVQQRANPDLGPEYQQGGEGGLELYFGSRASLVATRYNQTVDELIALVRVDSADYTDAFKTQQGLRDWASPLVVRQHLNIGSIRNQGWELQGTMNTGPLTTRATYSWTKSRTIGIDPQYRQQFQPVSFYPQYQIGATFAYFPEHTWAVGLTYAHAQTTVALNVNGVGSFVNSADELSSRYLSSTIRLQSYDRWNLSGLGYRSNVEGYTMGDLSVTHRFTSHIEGLLQIQNLGNLYVNDYDATYPTIGRQSKVGARLRF